VSHASLHRDAIVVLREWAAPTPEQETLREGFIRLLTEYDDATARTCFPDHLTAGVIVFSTDLSQVLLNLHAKAQRWFAFGGHLEDGDETLLHAAAREGREESGLASLDLLAEPVHLSCHPVDFCDPRGRVHHYDVRFAAVAPTGSKPEVSDESSDVRWFAVADLPTDEPDMIELITQAADRLRRS